MMAPDNTPPTSRAGKAALHQRRGVRQLVKFGIVGATSTIISFVIFNFVLSVWHQNRYTSETLAFCISVVNGYVWNKRWTFKDTPVRAVHTQFIQFVLVNVVGLLIDLLIMRLISVPLEHQFGVSLKVAANIAKLFAVAIVFFWNFFANRLWTFKH